MTSKPKFFTAQYAKMPLSAKVQQTNSLGRVVTFSVINRSGYYNLHITFDGPSGNQLRVNNYDCNLIDLAQHFRDLSDAQDFNWSDDLFGMVLVALNK